MRGRTRTHAARTHAHTSARAHTHMHIPREGGCWAGGAADRELEAVALAELEAVALALALSTALPTLSGARCPSACLTPFSLTTCATSMPFSCTCVWGVWGNGGGDEGRGGERDVGVREVPRAFVHARVRSRYTCLFVFALGFVCPHEHLHC